MSQTVTMGRQFRLMCHLLEGKQASFRWNFTPFVSQGRHISHSARFIEDPRPRGYRSRSDVRRPRGEAIAILPPTRERKTSRGHNDRFNVKSTNHWSMLSIDQATAEDAGVYECSASNGVHRDHSSTRIQIQGRK